MAIIAFGMTNGIFAVCLDQWPFKVPVLLRLEQDEDFGNLDSSSSSFIFLDSIRTFSSVFLLSSCQSVCSR